MKWIYLLLSTVTNMTTVKIVDKFNMVGNCSCKKTINGNGSVTWVITDVESSASLSTYTETFEGKRNSSPQRQVSLRSVGT